MANFTVPITAHLISSTVEPMATVISQGDSACVQPYCTKKPNYSAGQHHQSPFRHLERTLNAPGTHPERAIDKDPGPAVC